MAENYKKEIYNYFIKALELNYERKDFCSLFYEREDQIYIGKLLDKMEEIGILEMRIFFQKVLHLRLQIVVI